MWYRVRSSKSLRVSFSLKVPGVHAISHRNAKMRQYIARHRKFLCRTTADKDTIPFNYCDHAKLRLWNILIQKKKKQKWQQLSLSVPAPTSGCRIWATSNVTEHHLHNHLIEVCIPLQYDVASPVTCIFTLRENVIVPKRRKLFTQWPASYPRKRNSQPYLSEKFEALNLLKYLVFNVMEYPKITNDRTISPFFIVLVFVFNNPFLNCTIEKLQKLWLLEWNCSGRKCI